MSQLSLHANHQPRNSWKRLPPPTKKTTQPNPTCRAPAGRVTRCPCRWHPRLHGMQHSTLALTHRPTMAAAGTCRPPWAPSRQQMRPKECQRHSSPPDIPEMLHAHTGCPASCGAANIRQHIQPPPQPTCCPQLPGRHGSAPITTATCATLPPNGTTPWGARRC